MARVQYSPGTLPGLTAYRAGYGGYLQPGIRHSGPVVSIRYPRVIRQDYCSTQRTDTVSLSSGGTIGQVYRIYCRETGKSAQVTYPGSVTFMHTLNTTYHYDVPELSAFGLGYTTALYPAKPVRAR